MYSCIRLKTETTARIIANWEYHHTRIINERKMKPHQQISVATAVTPKETQPITVSILSTFELSRKLEISCHSTTIKSSSGKKKFIKALGTNSILKMITNKAMKMVGK